MTCKRCKATHDILVSLDMGAVAKAAFLGLVINADTHMAKHKNTNTHAAMIAHLRVYMHIIYWSELDGPSKIAGRMRPAISDQSLLVNGPAQLRSGAHNLFAACCTRLAAVQHRTYVLTLCTYAYHAW